jgi:hypothetical protein
VLSFGSLPVKRASRVFLIANQDKTFRFFSFVIERVNAVNS